MTWYPDSEDFYQEGSNVIMFTKDGITWENTTTPLNPVGNVFFEQGLIFQQLF